MGDRLAKTSYIPLEGALSRNEPSNPMGNMAIANF
jgi:hypothetical protein